MKPAGEKVKKPGPNDAWKTEMFSYGQQVAYMKRFFTTDDIFKLAYAKGLNSTTHDPRALGPVMLALARAKIIGKANAPFQLSSRRSRHHAPLQVWESLVYKHDHRAIYQPHHS